MRKTLLLIVALVATFAAKAVEPSGTLPVVYITTQNSAEITSTENYMNATFFMYY